MKGKRMILRAGIGVIVGGLFGYVVMYKLIGCGTGTCPITRNPIISTIYGALLGGLIAAWV